MMKQKLMEKMMEKKGKPLSPVEQDAKMSVLKHLHDLANDGLMGKLHGLKKVSVMSNSPEGMEEGLDKAKEMLDGHEGPDEDPKHEAMETPAEEEMEHETGEELHPDAEHPMDEEDLDRKIAELMALKEKLKK